MLLLPHSPIGAVSQSPDFCPVMVCGYCVKFLCGPKAMRFSALCLLGVSLLLPIPQQKTPFATVNPNCLSFSFEGRVNGGEEYTHELGGGLRIRLLPGQKKWGWVLQVQPLDNTDDYAYPVNPPYHYANSQWLSTGYDETVEQQLKYEHEIYFVLNQAEYERAMKLVDDALYSNDSQAAEKLLSTLPSLRSAVLKIKPIKYETADEGRGVNWMQFGVTVTVPANFPLPSGFDAKRIACLVNRP